MEETKVTKPKGIKVYGFKDDGIDIIFKTREAAERYNQVYFKGFYEIKELEIYNDYTQYERINPKEHLLRLLKEKAIFVNTIKFPFTIVRTHRHYTTEKRSEGSSFSSLKELLTKANEILRQKYHYPKDVDEEDKLTIEIKDYSMQLPVKDIMTLYKLFKETGKKINDINKQIQDVLASTNISEDDYKEVLKEAHINEENSYTEEKAYEFEMLEKEAYIEKDYMSLE